MTGNPYSLARMKNDLHHRSAPLHSSSASSTHRPPSYTVSSGSGSGSTPAAYSMASGSGSLQVQKRASHTLVPG
jgi:hypothetical protein